MSNPTKSLGYHLRVACQSRQRSMNRILKPFDITHAQYMVMQYLSWASEDNAIAGLSQNKLAQAIGLDAMMVSNILTLLEKKKYITRKKAGQGLQITGLSLTKKGSELIQGAHSAVVELDDKLFDTKDPKKLKKQLKQIVEQSQE